MMSGKPRLFTRPTVSLGAKPCVAQTRLQAEDAPHLQLGALGHQIADVVGVAAEPGAGRASRETLSSRTAHDP